MQTQDTRIHSFWKWFAEHQSELEALSKPDEPFWGVVLEQIKQVDERLWIELSASDEPPRELIVTAEGNLEAFPVVEALIDLAPKIEGWMFRALKPPMGFTFTTRYEDILLEPEAMWFLPLDSPSRPETFGMRVGVQGLESLDKATVHNAVLMILDTALGERAAALDIQYTEVAELPSDPKSAGYIELPELPDFIAWRKRNRISRV